MLFKLLCPRHEGSIRRILHELENIWLFLLPFPHKEIFLLDHDYLVQLIEGAAIKDADNVGSQFDGGLMLLFDDLDLFFLLDKVTLHPSENIIPLGFQTVHPHLNLLEDVLLLQQVQGLAYFLIRQFIIILVVVNLFIGLLRVLSPFPA